MPKQANTSRKSQPLGASQSQIQKGGSGYETNKDRQMLLRKYRKEVMDFAKIGENPNTINGLSEGARTRLEKKQFMVDSLVTLGAKPPKKKCINFKELKDLRREEKKQAEKLKSEQAILHIGSSVEPSKQELMRQTAKVKVSKEIEKLNQMRGNRRGTWENKEKNGFLPTIGRFKRDGALHLDPEDIKKISEGHTVMNPEFRSKSLEKMRDQRKESGGPQAKKYKGFKKGGKGKPKGGNRKGGKR